MGRLKLSALVGALMVLAPTAGALAADYFPPPPPPTVMPWYLRAYIGMTNQDFSGLEHPDFDLPAYTTWLDPGHFDAGPLFGFGIGVGGNHLRFDLTGEYRGKVEFSALQEYDVDSDPLDFVNWGTDQYTGKKSEWLFLANAYFDLGTWHGITPYIGAGIGTSRNTISDFVDVNVITSGQGWAPTGHKWDLAWALHAGAGFKVTNNLTIDVQYSFVNLGDAQTGNLVNVDPINYPCPTVCSPMVFKNLYSHDIKLGIRWALGG
jgi:opacity protein-like surface antigen